MITVSPFKTMVVDFDNFTRDYQIKALFEHSLIDVGSPMDVLSDPFPFLRSSVRCIVMAIIACVSMHLCSRLKLLTPGLSRKVLNYRPEE